MKNLQKHQSQIPNKNNEPNDASAEGASSRFIELADTNIDLPKSPIHDLTSNDRQLIIDEIATPYLEELSGFESLKGGHEVKKNIPNPQKESLARAAYTFHGVYLLNGKKVKYRGTATKIGHGLFLTAGHSIVKHKWGKRSFDRPLILLRGYIYDHPNWKLCTEATVLPKFRNGNYSPAYDMGVLTLATDPSKGNAPIELNGPRNSDVYLAGVDTNSGLKIYRGKLLPSPPAFHISRIPSFSVLSGGPLSNSRMLVGIHIGT